MPAEMPNDVSAEKPRSAEHRDGALVGVHGLPDLAALKAAFNGPARRGKMKPKTFRACCRGRQLLHQLRPLALDRPLRPSRVIYPSLSMLGDEEASTRQPSETIVHGSKP
jgi:hypothetical protein